MPNRMIKDTIRTSKHVNELSDFHFRVWLYLITYVDDYGRGSADPELLKGLVFPRRRGVTEEQIEGALTLLANKGMITLYEVDGESYFFFPSWGEHQRIQTKKSKFPDPQKSTVIHRESPPKPNQTKRETKTETEEEIETEKQNTNILSEKENGQKKEPLPAGDPAQREAICPITKAEAEEILSLPTKDFETRAKELPPEIYLQLVAERAERKYGRGPTGGRPWDSR